MCRAYQRLRNDLPAEHTSRARRYPQRFGAEEVSLELLDLDRCRDMRVFSLVLVSAWYVCHDVRMMFDFGMGSIEATAREITQFNTRRAWRRLRKAADLGSAIPGAHPAYTCLHPT